MFPSSPPHLATYNQEGLVKDEVAPKTFLHNGTNIRKVGVDGVILISTDAASKITERAIGQAFDRWAETIVKNHNETGDKKEEDEKTETISQNPNPKKIPSNTTTFLATSSKESNK